MPRLQDADDGAEEVMRRSTRIVAHWQHQGAVIFRQCVWRSGRYVPMNEIFTALTTPQSA